MKNSYHLLLIDTEIKAQLNKYCTDKVTAWTKLWGFECQPEELNISIDEKYSSCQQNALSIQQSICLHNISIIGINIKNTCEDIFGKLIHQKPPAKNSRLLDHLTDDCFKDLQSSLISDYYPNTEDYVFALKPQSPQQDQKYLKVSIRSSSLYLDFFLSSYLVDNILEKYLNQKKKKTGDIHNVSECLSKESVLFSVEYGKTTITVEELFSIKIGDVIRLKKKTNEPMTARSIQGDKLFDCQLGIKQGHLSIKALST